MQAFGNGRFVTSSPTNKKGYCVITDVEKQFIKGELKTEEEAIGIGNMNLWK